MLKTMADRVARSHHKTGNEEEVFVDPASISMYIAIITAVVKLVKRCREAKSVPESAEQPSMYEQMVVKRIVRRKLGFKKYRREGKDIAQSVFEVGAGSAPEEIEELYNEV